MLICFFFPSFDGLQVFYFLNLFEIWLKERLKYIFKTVDDEFIYNKCIPYLFMFIYLLLFLLLIHSCSYII